MRLLVTGGAGYIGSHVCLALLDAGHEVTIVDSFINSVPANIEAITEAAGRKLVCIKADIRDVSRIRKTFGSSRFDGVLHLAALKSVPESIGHPERYQDVNERGTAVLLKETLHAGVSCFVFCSSAAVYGAQNGAPLLETDTPAPSTPYAQSKWAAEQLLQETASTHPGFRVCSLRCFNPIGSHPSARFARRQDLPLDLLTNVLLARHTGSPVDIYGMDYPTSDRTAVRDFIHVMDVADGCVAAVSFLTTKTTESAESATTFNLGSGRGCSVLNLIETTKRVGAKAISWRQKARRTGDIAVSVADTQFSAATLNWQARRSLEEGCADALRSFERTLVR